MAAVKAGRLFTSWSGIGKMYDDLINTVPEDLSVLECMVGLHWTLIRSEKGTGIARTLTGGKEESELHNIIGMRLKDLAAYVKSWNLTEASLGMAAINSALNHQNHVEEISDPGCDSSFDRFVAAFVGKKVATVGNFPMLEPLKDICRLTIIEREPLGRNYSEGVSEYLLPDQDFVFITGTTFLYKTAPRLIELSKNAKIILVGASVPLSRILFNYGVDTLAGIVAKDEEMLWQTVREGRKKSVLEESTQSVFIQR